VAVLLLQRMKLGVAIPWDKVLAVATR